MQESKKNVFTVSRLLHHRPGLKSHGIGWTAGRTKRVLRDKIRSSSITCAIWLEVKQLKTHDPSLSGSIDHTQADDENQTRSEHRQVLFTLKAPGGS